MPADRQLARRRRTTDVGRAVGTQLDTDEGPEGHRGDHPRRRVGPPDLTSSMAAHTMVLHSFLRRPQGIGQVKQEGWKPQEGGYPTSKTPWQSSSTER